MIERNYRLMLLLVVGLLTTLFTAAVGGFQSPETAASETILASSDSSPALLQPVRVVGTPFVPNIRPSER